MIAVVASESAGAEGRQAVEQRALATDEAALDAALTMRSVHGFDESGVGDGVVIVSAEGLTIAGASNVEPEAADPEGISM